MNIQLISIIILLTTVWSSNCHSTVILPIYGQDPASWGEYGGDVQYGEMKWSTDNGSADFVIELDTSFTIFGFSFNTTIPSYDFVIDITEELEWDYRGLNTEEGIGTDRFDYSIFRRDMGSSHILEFSILGSNINQDSDFFRPNLFPENPDVWDARNHRSHFGVYASDSEGSIHTLSDIFHDPDADTVPEPSTYMLLVLGLASLLVCRKHLAD